VSEPRYSESVDIARAPHEVYALVSDVTRMGRWSPVCKACWWDEGAGPQVGAWFTGRNETPERTWETRCRVVAAEPDREFAWEVVVEGTGWVRWGFTVEPLAPASAGESAGAGTRLTQHWHFLPAGLAGFRERFGDRADAEIAARTEAAHAGIPATLAAIKADAEHAA